MGGEVPREGALSPRSRFRGVRFLPSCPAPFLGNAPSPERPTPVETMNPRERKATRARVRGLPVTPLLARAPSRATCGFSEARTKRGAFRGKGTLRRAPDGAFASEREESAVRIPLHVKLMGSYLVVVGLVFLPTLVYLGTIQRREVHATQVRDLTTEAQRIGERLHRTPPDQLSQTIDFVLTLLPERVTVIARDGRVLADSYTAGELENHTDTPEVRQALTEGVGVAERRSETTGRTLLYVAAAWPRGAPAEGVVRLAVEANSIDAQGAQGTVFLNRASGVALSAAVLLSLLAALVVSRPLRRIAQSARAFAAGDFGHPVDVRTDDELGEAARALEDLGAQMRDRLLAAGADRAALHALVDELPTGVILFDARLEPVLINAPARLLAGFDASQEVERARQIPRLGEHAQAVAQVLEHGGSVDLELSAPWGNPASVVARWVLVHASNGTRQPALLLLDRAGELREATHLDAMRRAADRLNDGARALGQTPLASRLRRMADELSALVPPPPARATDLAMLPLGGLLSDVLLDLDEARRGDVELALDDENTLVIEALGRTHRSLRAFLKEALDHSPAGEMVQLTTEPAGRCVRVVAHIPGIPRAMPHAARELRALGGDAGFERDGEQTRAWMLVPRG